MFVVKIEEQDAEKVVCGRCETSEASTTRSDLPIDATLSCSMHAMRPMRTTLKYAFPYAWETFTCRSLNKVKARLRHDSGGRATLLRKTNVVLPWSGAVRQPGDCRECFEVHITQVVRCLPLSFQNATICVFAESVTTSNALERLSMVLAAWASLALSKKRSRHVLFFILIWKVVVLVQGIVLYEKNHIEAETEHGKEQLGRITSDSTPVCLQRAVYDQLKQRHYATNKVEPDHVNSPACC